MAYTGTQPARAPLTSGDITDGIVATEDLAASSVTAAKVADGNITTAKIADSNVTTAKVADGNITTAKVADGNITSAKMDANITITGTSSAADFKSTSDINLKENLEVIQSPLQKLQNINGYTFNWKENGEEAVGVVAQEVEQIFPQLVNVGEDGNKRVNYDALVPVLIEAIKELNNKLDSK